MNTTTACLLLLSTVTVPFAPGCGALSAANDPGEARFFSMERATSQTVAALAEVPGGTGDPLKLRLGRVTGAPHLEERIVYRDSAHEVGYYREVRWSEPPELFLKRQLARVLFEERRIRHVMGGADKTLVVKLTALDELLSEREKLNESLQEILDKHTDPWGIKITMVEVKAVDLPIEMQRAMAKQAEAEREKRAKIIHASGEFEASKQLAEAAHIIATEPASMQLRYLQTLTEIAAEKNSTILFPVPIEMMALLGQKMAKDVK